MREMPEKIDRDLKVEQREHLFSNDGVKERGYIIDTLMCRDMSMTKTKTKQI